MRTRLLALLLLSFLVTSASAEDCPTSCGVWSPYGPPYSGWVTQFCSPAAVLDTSSYNSVCFSGSKVNVTQGTIEQHTGSGFGGCFYGITLDDDYRVVGLPDGTQVPLVFHLDAIAEISGWNGGDAHVVVSSPLAPTQSWALGPIAGTPPEPTVSDSKSLALALMATVGTPFRIAIWMDAGSFGESGTILRGNYWFDGVPAAAAIISCRGFVQAEVGAATSTWGRIKAGYR